MKDSNINLVFVNMVFQENCNSIYNSNASLSRAFCKIKYKNIIMLHMLLSSSSIDIKQLIVNAYPDSFTALIFSFISTSLSSIHFSIHFLNQWFP
jgi:hypothetical protein